MIPVTSTSEILAFKVLGRNIDKRWVDWAVEMLVEGYDTENLVILAGETAPYNQFELQDLTTKVFEELSLDFSDKNRTIQQYICFLIDKTLQGERDNLKTLEIIKDFYYEMNMDKTLFDFYLLYYAKDDLQHDKVQWYWPDANRTNIDEIIKDVFLKWKMDCYSPSNGA